MTFHSNSTYCQLGPGQGDYTATRFRTCATSSYISGCHLYWRTVHQTPGQHPRTRPVGYTHRLFSLLPNQCSSSKTGPSEHRHGSDHVHQVVTLQHQGVQRGEPKMWGLLQWQFLPPLPCPWLDLRKKYQGQGDYTQIYIPIILYIYYNIYI